MLATHKHQFTSAFKRAADSVLGSPFTGTIVLEKPKQFSHGDLACNLAMQLAKPAKQNPRQLAQALVDHLMADEALKSLIDGIEIAGPGFINIRFSDQVRTELLHAVLDQGQQYGHLPTQNRPIILEFVSANPTGPLHVGHGRQAALGDVLANVLNSQGWQVHKEFYYNDAGVQIQNLAVSVQSRVKGIKPGDPEWPESAYNGQYIADIAQAYLNGHEVQAFDDSPVKGAGDAEDLQAIKQFAVAYLRAEQDIDLQSFGVKFDQFYLESSLYSEGKVESVVQALIGSGHTYEEGGALWLRTTGFGDDKDRVMRKSEGGYTYFVPDVAYHITKFQRGFKEAVNIQGSDHHGTISRVRAGLQACQAGIPEGYPEYVLHKMVNVMKGGKEVKISKRAGSYVTVRDLIFWSGGVDESVALEAQTEALVRGRDAVRFFLVSRKPDTEFVFDVDLALSKSDENPVYYVQYAHARIHSILRQCEMRIEQLKAAQVKRLKQDTERLLIQQIAGYGDVLAKAAQERAPHHVAFYLRDLAGAFHSFYNAERVLIDQEELKLARLLLLKATASVIENGMGILGVSAPVRM